jgi:hypothetical protein
MLRRRTTDPFPPPTDHPSHGHNRHTARHVTDDVTLLDFDSCKRHMVSAGLCQ